MPNPEKWGKMSKKVPSGQQKGPEEYALGWATPAKYVIPQGIGRKVDGNRSACFR
jgi:hypothetical protein